MTKQGFWFVVAVCVTFGPFSMADYANPPGWENSADFTHQSWVFDYDYMDTDSDGLVLHNQFNAYLPLEPDDPNYPNPFGEALFTEFYNSTPGVMQGWMYKPHGITTDRCCMMGGVLGDTRLTFAVAGPNEPDQPRQIWLQMAYYARKDGEQTYLIEVARDAAFTDTTHILTIYEKTEELAEPEGYSGKWYRTTGKYIIEDPGNDDPNNPHYVRVTSYHDPVLPDPQRYGVSMIDQVDIDTRSIRFPDLVQDCTINYRDFAVFSQSWESATPDPAADLDGDGLVTMEDLYVFIDWWLYMCYW